VGVLGTGPLARAAAMAARDASSHGRRPWGSAASPRLVANVTLRQAVGGQAARQVCAQEGDEWAALVGGDSASVGYLGAEVLPVVAHTAAGRRLSLDFPGLFRIAWASPLVARAVPPLASSFGGSLSIVFQHSEDSAGLAESIYLATASAEGTVVREFRVSTAPQLSRHGPYNAAAAFGVLLVAAQRHVRARNGPCRGLRRATSGRRCNGCGGPMLGSSLRS